MKLRRLCAGIAALLLAGLGLHVGSADRGPLHLYSPPLALNNIFSPHAKLHAIFEEGWTCVVVAIEPGKQPGRAVDLRFTLQLDGTAGTGAPPASAMSPSPSPSVPSSSSSPSLRPSDASSTGGLTPASPTSSLEATRQSGQDAQPEGRSNSVVGTVVAALLGAALVGGGIAWALVRRRGR